MYPSLSPPVVLHLVDKETYYVVLFTVGDRMVPCWLFLILAGCCYGGALRLEDTPSSKKRSIAYSRFPTWKGEFDKEFQLCTICVNPIVVVLHAVFVL